MTDNDSHGNFSTRGQSAERMTTLEKAAQTKLQRQFSDNLKHMMTATLQGPVNMEGAVDRGQDTIEDICLLLSDGYTQQSSQELRQFEAVAQAMDNLFNKVEQALEDHLFDNLDETIVAKEWAEEWAEELSKVEEAFNNACGNEIEHQQ